MFSFINIFGLALAMSVCMLMLLMLSDQRRYDKFNVKNDRIYRILSGTNRTRQNYATTPFPVAEALKADYAVVEDITHLTPGIGGDGVYAQHGAEMKGYFADPSFFKVFSFELQAGDKGTALTSPNSMVITATIAKQLFGTENPLGKVIEFSDRQLPFPISFDGVSAAAVPWGGFTVTGVIDETKYKSHLKFDMLASEASRPALYAEKKISDITNDWTWFYRVYTYALLRKDKTEADLSAALTDLVKRKYASIKNEEVQGFMLTPQKLADVQMGLKGNDTNNRLPDLGYYFMAVLAVVIMISACLNYTNLSIARAITRAKEIGVRKVIGAKRKDLVYQFLSESVLTTVLAMMMAVLMLFLIKPAFRGLWVNQYLNFELPTTVADYLSFFAFAMLIGLIAGAYPALHLSGYQPIQSLKSLSSMRPGKMGLRKTLSISQFVISMFFITTSILIFNQFKHFLKFDYGFNSHNMVNIDLQGVDYKKLEHKISNVPGVTMISASDIIPATGRHNADEVKRAGTAEEFSSAGILITDEKFIANMGIRLIAGKPLPANGDGSDRFVLVNESAVKKFGYKHPEEMVGLVLESKWGKESLEVIGVTSNFRTNLLINAAEITPLIMRNRPEQFTWLSVKINSSDVMATVSRIEQQWKTVDAVHPFKYEFYDQALKSTHRGIFDAVTILGFISFIAVTIACLGLLGMATYISERRRKEVGIRKVLGAERFGIALLLSREFLTMLCISIAIAAPLSYFVNNLWLQHFPNRVEFGFGTVFLGTMVLTVLGLLTIGSQTLSAAKRNPVEMLKME